MINPGQDAIAEKGYIQTYKWLVLRRATQLLIIVLFLTGPLFDIWILKGNLSASLLLDQIPMTEPLSYLQVIATGQLPASTATIGLVIIIGFYGLFAGRSFCGWVCPVNVLSDASRWLRRKMGFKKGANIHKHFRYYVLGAILLTTALSGTVVWENLNPVSATHRSIIYGWGVNYFIVLAVVALELFYSNYAWCSKLCPQGALYALIGSKSIIKASAYARDNCNKCMDCFEVCPEPLIISPALHPKSNNTSPIINASTCTLCGRCIDICSKDVFKFTSRFNHQLEKAS